MKTGRRVANPAAKQLAGTFRKDRHATITTIAQPSKNEPTQPGYMSDIAKEVWAEEFRRVVACGVTEADSSLFGRYCEMEAVFRAGVKNGEVPKAALLTELRRCAELLGIAGLRSRLAKSTGGEAPKASTFTVRT
jgi:phage terminase small subunit